MFGCYALYEHGILSLFMMKRDESLNAGAKVTLENGIYLATSDRYADELQMDFLDAEFQMLKEGKVWIFFPDTSPTFEAYTIKACKMIVARDRRVGR